MSYGTKYILAFKDRFDNDWEFDIQLDGYSGDSSYLTGTGNKIAPPLKLNYDVANIDLFSPIKASSLEMSLLESSHNAYAEFFTRDRYAKGKLYKNSNLFWQGWSIASNYISKYNLSPKPVTITFVDGLTFLRHKDFNVSTTPFTDADYYTVIKYFQQILTYIGLETSFYESIVTFGTHMNRTGRPLEQTSLNTWAFYLGKDEQIYKSLYDVLTEILTIYGARIYQKDGCWYVDQIRQLQNGSVSYRRYNSSFVYQDSASETLDKDITTVDGSPMLVPINHSLFTQHDDRYSEFTLMSNYGLKQNLIRYPLTFTNIESEYRLWNIEDSQTLAPNIWLDIDDDASVDNYQEGIRYDLGRIDFDGLKHGKDLTDVLLDFTMHLKYRGVITIRLYIDNIADNKKYYYTYDPDLTDASQANHRWAEYTGGARVENSGSPTGYIQMSCLAVFYHSLSNYGNKEATVTIPIHVGYGSILHGQMYLVINKPSSPGVSGPAADFRFTIDELAVNYYECARQNYQIKITSSAFNDLTKNVTTQLYSHMLFYKRIAYKEGTYKEWKEPYINAHLVYPGLLYYHDGTYYQPERMFMIYEGSKRKRARTTIEEILAEDIMTYYANLRYKAKGDLLGDNMDFGKVLDYDGYRYVIVSMNMSIKSGIISVILLQVSELERFWITEDGDYVETEDGKVIIF